MTTPTASHQDTASTAKPSLSEDENQTTGTDTQSLDVVERSQTGHDVANQNQDLVSEVEPVEPHQVVAETPAQNQAADPNAVGIYGFGKGVGDGLYLGEVISPSEITAEMRGKVLLATMIPNAHFMFKASAVGIEAIVIASNNLSKAEALGDEVAGKARIGFLVVSEDYNLRALEGKRIVIDGSKKILGV